MDVGAMKFRVPNRTLWVIIPLVTLLVASGIGNIRQYRIIERLRARELAMQQETAARVQAEAEREKARLKKKADWAASDARVQQLYQEIDTLSQISEHTLAQPVQHQATPVNATGHGRADNMP
jgi:hypothetical protein